MPLMMVMIGNLQLWTTPNLETYKKMNNFHSYVSRFIFLPTLTQKNGAEVSNRRDS